MSYDNFKKALAFTLKWEGGVSNDSDDPGGLTNKGITQAVYDKYRMGLYEATRSVKELEEMEMNDIYFKGYWVAGHCEALDKKSAICHFDACVNTGTQRAIKLLQEALNVKQDGIFGPNTLHEATVANELTDKMLLARTNFYTELASTKPTLNKFLKGWLNRVEDLRKYLVRV